MQIKLFPNRKIVTLENISSFGEFKVGTIAGKSGAVIVFENKFYDMRSSRQGAEWAAAKFDPDHARKHNEQRKN